MAKTDHIVFECDCGLLEHICRITHFEDQQPGVFYLEMMMFNWQNPLRRIWTAIRYIFGKKSPYGHFDEIILDPGDAAILRDFLDDRLQHLKFDHKGEALYLHHDKPKE
jgi:hypothetical protein